MIIALSSYRAPKAPWRGCNLVIPVMITTRYSDIFLSKQIDTGKADLQHLLPLWHYTPHIYNSKLVKTNVNTFIIGLKLASRWDAC